MVMTPLDLLDKIRTAIESDEDEVVKVIEIQFLFDEYDRITGKVEI